PYGEFLAIDPAQKGIVPEVLRPGFHTVHPYMLRLDRYAPVTVPAGYRGVVTLLAGPLPDDPNVLLVPDGRRGVQTTSKEEGTYYIDPSVERISLIDCRSQRISMAEEHDLGFPTRDG